MRSASLFAAGVTIAWVLAIRSEEGAVKPARVARAQALNDPSPAPAVMPLSAPRTAPRTAPRLEPPRAMLQPAMAESELAPGEEEPPRVPRPTRAELDATHAQEPKDEAWSTELATYFQEELVARGFDERMIYSVDCRTTLCLTRIKLATGASLMTLSSLAAELPGLAFSFEVEEQHDGSLASVYLKRRP